jgi:ABC-type multidrug transport system fused ATPase/permease subunit
VEHLKKLIKKYLTHFSYFYVHLRYRLFLTLALSLMVAVLDGFGLAMFLPLLQVADGAGRVEAESLGHLRFLVDGLQSMGVALTLYSVLLVILVFFVFKGIAKFGEGYYKVIAGQYFIKQLRFDNVDKLSNYNYKAFVMADSGRIQNTLSGEVGRVAMAYTNYMAAVQAVVMVLMYVALAFLANPEFALLVAGGGFISNLVFRQVYQKTKAASLKVTHDGHTYQGLLIQQVAFFKYLKATGLIKSFSAKLKDYIARIEESNRKMGFYSALLTAVREPLVVLVVVVVIIVQVSYFSQNMAIIILSLMFFYRSLTYLINLQTNWNGFLTASGALENMTKFMRDLADHQECYGKQKFASFASTIELRKVSFAYGDKPVIKNINLTICKNETVAFVGESGSGKTTLVNLLAGLIPPTEGELYLDGKPSREIHIPSWRQRIGYITQEPVIFSDSVFNNITFWAEPTEINIARFWQALKKAAIADFVKQLPGQQNSYLGTGGILVSGGQKQRLSIARELYKDVDLLIMDEATSALDSETEQVIQENIDALRGHYTILIIAHRLATVKSADRIVLMKEGEIVDVGNFNSLLGSSALFSKMVALQEL